MKRICLFGIVNALLIGIVGLLIGLFCQNLFQTGVGIAAFIMLLVSLALPILILLTKNYGQGLVIILSLLMVAELVMNIVFMVKPNVDGKVFAITQASVVGAFLIATLCLIAFQDKKEE